MEYAIVLFAVSIPAFSVLCWEFLDRCLKSGSFFHILDISQNQTRVYLGSRFSPNGFTYFLGKFYCGVFVSCICEASVQDQVSQLILFFSNHDDGWIMLCFWGCGGFDGQHLLLLQCTVTKSGSYFMELLNDVLTLFVSWLFQPVGIVGEESFINLCCLGKCCQGYILAVCFQKRSHIRKMIGEVIFPVLIPFRKIAIWVTEEWVQDLQTSFCQFNELIEVWGTQFFHYRYSTVLPYRAGEFRIFPLDIDDEMSHIVFGRKGMQMNTITQINKVKSI